MRVVLYGAGQVGSMVAYLLSYDRDIEVVAVVDDDADTWGGQVRGVPVVGGPDRLPGLLADGVKGAISCIGINKIRGQVSHKLARMGFEIINAIHPSAVISTDAQLGRGCIIGAGVVLYVNPVIGDCVYFDVGAVVSHNSVIGDNALISAHATVSARVDIGRNVLVGVGAVVMVPEWGQSARVRVGDDAIVGAGALVIRDVPEKAVVVGVPAHILRYVED